MRPYSAAKLAVMSAPLTICFTTTVPCVMPATMRLRMGKLCLSPWRPARKLCDHRALLSNTLVEFDVLSRIYNVQPRAEHGDRLPTGSQRSFVRGTYTPCPTHHRDARRGQLAS